MQPQNNSMISSETHNFVFRPERRDEGARERKRVGMASWRDMKIFEFLESRSAGIETVKKETLEKLR